MIPFFLFFATAASACWLTWFWGGNGVAGIGEQEFGYAGALVMLFAAYVSAFTLWAGRCLAALALALFAAYCLCENVGMFPRLINFRVVLALLLLVVTAVYVIGSFRVRVLSVFYPRRASPAGMVVVWALIIAPALSFLWLKFWHDATQERSETVPASWQPVTLDRVTSGRRQMTFMFTAQDAPQSVTVASDELFDEIDSAQKKSVEVQIKETFKHGAMVAWNVEAIDGSRDFTMITPLPAPSVAAGAGR